LIKSSWEFHIEEQVIEFKKEVILKFEYTHLSFFPSPSAAQGGQSSAGK
jgi:hypothetical protein